jgi:hypothetical protein
VALALLALAKSAARLLIGQGGHFFVDTFLDCDPPPLKWSDLRYVFDIKEDCNGKEAIQA